MILKSDAKFKEKLNCRFIFKFDMRNLVNVHTNTQKSEKLYIDGLFLSKAYNVSVRKFQRDYVHDTEV